MNAIKKFWLLVIIVLSIIIITWNSNNARLDQVDENYIGCFYHGKLSDSRLNVNGVRVLKKWIETRTRPSVSPLNILWQHLWYNCFTTNYNQVIWISSPSEIAKRNYALYFSGQTIFLRIEYDGWNQVLIAKFTLAELEEELSKHLGPIAAEAKE